MPKIVLGTANFGSDYGIANKGNILTQEELKSIIHWAQTNGINHFDTGLAYIGSTQALNSYLDHSLEPEIDTKLNEKDCQTSEMIVQTAANLRAKLGVNALSVIYLHDEQLLQSSLASEVSRGLRDVLALGIAKNIGVSVYSKAGVVENKKVLPELSVFQVLENICDRRMIASSEIWSLYDEGNRFMIRSVFLQGLLLMQPNLIPSQLRLARRNVNELNVFGRNNSLTVLDLCVAYAKSISWASGIIVGVASLDQLKEIQKVTLTLPEGRETAISTLPPEIVDPRKWTL
jgi:aryl-alcohol dehydrogenase-like predicted oxidoreductase